MMKLVGVRKVHFGLDFSTIFKLIILIFTVFPLDSANYPPSLLSFSYVSSIKTRQTSYNSSNTEYCTRQANYRHSQESSNHCADAPGTSSILSDTSTEKMVLPSSTLRSTLKSI